MKPHIATHVHVTESCHVSSGAQRDSKEEDAYGHVTLYVTLGGDVTTVASLHTSSAEVLRRIAAAYTEAASQLDKLNRGKAIADRY